MYPLTTKIPILRLNVYAWLLKHEKSIDGYKVNRTDLQGQGAEEEQGNRAETFLFSLHIFGFFSFTS